MAVAQKKPSAAPLKELYDIGEIPPLGHVPAKMHAWAIRKERHGPPQTAMQLEVVPTWPIADDEVLVYVMAGGVNYNGVWAGLGVPVSPLDGHKHPFHIAGSDAVRHRLGGRLEGPALEGRRRSHRPLQSGRWRRRGLQRRRSVAVALAAHLGLRDAGRLVRAILPRAVAPADGQAGASDLGRSRPATRSRSPPPIACCSAIRRTSSSPATTCWCGAPRAGSACSACSLSPPPAPTPSASSPTNRNPNTCSISAPRASSTASEFKCWGAMPKVGTPGIRRLDQGSAPLRQGDLGNHRQARRRHRVRASGRGDVPGVVPGGQARRHGGVLRRHVGLQHHLRCALRLDAAEARAGLALRASETGQRRQPVRHRPPHRSVHERRVPLGENSVRARIDAHQPAQARQHGGAGQRAATTGLRNFEDALEAASLPELSRQSNRA